jgi:uncharacterized membrane protein
VRHVGRRPRPSPPCYTESVFTTAALARFVPGSLVVVGVGVVVVVVVLAVVVGLVVVGGNRRRGTSEVHSVDHYRRTLHTLSDIHARPTPTVRVLGRDAETTPPPPAVAPPPPSSPGSSRTRPGGAHQSGLRRGNGGATAPVGQPRPSGRPLVFGDETDAPSGGSSDRSRGRARAMSAMNHRPHRLAAPVAVIVVVVVVLALVVYLGGRHHTKPTSSGSASRATTTTRAAAAHGHGSTHTHTKGGGTTTAPTTTTTTAPPTFSPIQASATTASYVVPAQHYTLVVTATSGACWVQTTTVAGTSPYGETLQPGASHTITATGVMTVELGAPTAGVTINGIPVVFPIGYQTPFYMTVTPAAATTTTTAAPTASGAATSGSTVTAGSTVTTTTQAAPGT